jgi:hypothetical protein
MRLGDKLLTKESERVIFLTSKTSVFFFLFDGSFTKGSISLDIDLNKVSALSTISGVEVG